MWNPPTFLSISTPLANRDAALKASTLLEVAPGKAGRAVAGLNINTKPNVSAHPQQNLRGMGGQKESENPSFHSGPSLG